MTLHELAREALAEHEGPVDVISVHARSHQAQCALHEVTLVRLLGAGTYLDLSGRGLVTREIRAVSGKRTTVTFIEDLAFTVVTGNRLVLLAPPSSGAPARPVACLADLGLILREHRLTYEWMKTTLEAV